MHKHDRFQPEYACYLLQCILLCTGKRNALLSIVGYGEKSKIRAPALPKDSFLIKKEKGEVELSTDDRQRLQTQQMTTMIKGS